MNMAKLHILIDEALSAPDLPTARQAILDFAKKNKRGNRSWYVALVRMASALPLPTFALFTRDYHKTAKVPFYCWSTLPLYTCPGKGECANYCYSLRSWRYPFAFCRQLQNTLLLKWNPLAVKRAWMKIPLAQTVRLYVDGDIDSIQTWALWVHLLAERPDLQAYGYSKSLEVFSEWDRQVGLWPTNYKLNLSTGSAYDGQPIVDEVARLPICRGRFVTAPIRYGRSAADRFGNSEYHALVRQSARELTGQQRVFSCPGKCGSCLPQGEHACGSERMNGVLIAIGLH